jgi:signal transduction histidine kinase
MKRGSIRWRVALAAGIFSALIVVLFALSSAAWFYCEQSEPTDGEPAALSAQRITDARDDVTELLATYLGVLPFVALLTASGAWWLAGRLIQPLSALALAAERIDARSLGQRLPEPRGDDEIAALSRTLNGLLARLEKSFAQAGRFTADASHEFRTPLAIMRGTLEEAIQADPTGPQADLLVSLLEENQRLASVAEKLLMLARADAGELVAASERVNLTELTQAIADDFAILAESKGLRLECSAEPDVTVRGDPHLLRHLLLNLFDNALRHNEEKGSVTICLKTKDGLVFLSLNNSGAAIPVAAQSRLFERFFRAESSRERGTGGAGLGLSLCAEIASAHAGVLNLVSSDAGGTTFQLTLPLAGSGKP